MHLQLMRGCCTSDLPDSYRLAPDYRTQRKEVAGMVPARVADGVTWRKSTRSAANGNCVEVARLAGEIAVRDSKDPDGAVLRFSNAAWRGFIASVRGGGVVDPTGH
jgi:Domain of unknown function (DUF397)